MKTLGVVLSIVALLFTVAPQVEAGHDVFGAVLGQMLGGAAKGAAGGAAFGAVLGKDVGQYAGAGAAAGAAGVVFDGVFGAIFGGGHQGGHNPVYSPHFPQAPGHGVFVAASPAYPQYFPGTGLIAGWWVWIPAHQDGNGFVPGYYRYRGTCDFIPPQTGTWYDCLGSQTPHVVYHHR